MFRTKKPTRHLKISTLPIFECKSIANIVCDYLSHQDRKKLEKSNEWKEIIENLVTPTQTQQLLNYVKEANGEKIDKILQKNSELWQLMFFSTEHVLPDGKKIETITPLKYAVKIVDIYTIKKLLSYVPKEQTPLFYQHIQEQKQFIDFNPLFKAYEKLIQAPYLEMGRELGHQLRILANYARHFLHEMGRPNSNWSSDAKFSDSKPWYECDVKDLIFTREKRPLPDLIENPDALYSYPFFSNPYQTKISIRHVPLNLIFSDLGQDLILIRGSNRSVECARDGYSFLKSWRDEIQIDLAVFRRLFNIRKEDLARLVQARVIDRVNDNRIKMGKQSVSF